MTPRQVFDLTLLAALWGASFLFMRVSVPEFGAIALIFVRVLLAGLLLAPIIFWKKQQSILWEHIVPISIVGIINSAIPFTLIAYSTFYLTAGFASVLNAATPIFASIIAYIWLKQQLSQSSLIGLVIGFFGVVLLVLSKMGFSNPFQNEMSIAVLAGVASTIAYGIGANYSKVKLKGVDATVITTGSQLVAAIVLMPLALFYWPESTPSFSGWLNVILLAVICTAWAQIIYFKLIEDVGATRATTVTFLIPGFGLMWGFLFLNEVILIETVIAGGVILLGTGMATGLIKLKIGGASNNL